MEKTRQALLELASCVRSSGAFRDVRENEPASRKRAIPANEEPLSLFSFDDGSGDGDTRPGKKQAASKYVERNVKGNVPDFVKAEFWDHACSYREQDHGNSENIITDRHGNCQGDLLPRDDGEFAQELKTWLRGSSNPHVHIRLTTYGALVQCEIRWRQILGSVLVPYKPQTLTTLDAPDQLLPVVAPQIFDLLDDGERTEVLNRCANPQMPILEICQHACTLIKLFPANLTLYRVLIHTYSYDMVYEYLSTSSNARVGISGSVGGFQDADAASLIIKFIDHGVGHDCLLPQSKSIAKAFFRDELMHRFDGISVPRLAFANFTCFLIVHFDVPRHSALYRS